MKKLLLVFLFFSSSAAILQAQEIKVSGKVTGATASSTVEGISVSLKGTGRTTATTKDGEYIITAPPKGTLVFSGVGVKVKEVAINGATTINVSLEEDAAEMDAVVVTALGISRQKKSLGYATQQIAGADLSVGRENNVVNALTGRAAGVVITRSSAGPGSSTRISLRGEKSLVGNNQPLIVIDGVPVDNTTRGGTGEFNDADDGDAIGNLSADDIESINILRGPNAAALYGARANNGVLVVTTKKGRKQRGLGITFSNNTSLENPLYEIARQGQYAQGSNINTYSTTNEESWGPKITGQAIDNWVGTSYTAANQNHVGEFFQTGLNVNNALSLSAGSEKSQLRISYNNLSAKGIVPKNTQDRHSFTVRGTSDLGKLNIDVKLNYIYQKIMNRPQGGEEGLNPYSDVLRMPTTVRNSDLQNFLNSSGTFPQNNFFAPNNAIISNPYWMVNRTTPSEVRNRLIATTTLRYNIIGKLNLTGRIGLDRYNDDNERKLFAGTPTPFTQNSAGGNYTFDKFSQNELNMEAFFDYQANITNDLSVSALLGTALRRNRIEGVGGSAGGLDLPDLFVLSNGKAITANNFLNRQELQSVYSTLQFGYKSAIFLDFTGRNDWASTLPKQNRSYFYPSASLSAVVSELTTLPAWWNYAKLRTSYAFVGKDASAYSYTQLLNASQGVVGTILRNDATLVNPDLKPEQTRAFEIGTELKFLKGRIGIDFTFYNTNSVNQIIPLPLPVSAGFTTRLINAGQIKNTGIEILATLGIIKSSKGFTWDVMLNYSRNRNSVVKLDAAQKQYLIASTRVADVRADEGTRMGEMYVRGFVRDAEGLVQIAASGLPQTTSARSLYAGNIFPDWTGGVNNQLTYKQWKVDFLVDARVGGVVASHTQAVLAGLGKLPETLEGRDANNYIAKGVLTGTKTANNIPINPRSYWQLVGGRGNPVGEVWVYDATAIRLRQFSVGYQLPAAMVSKLKLTAVDVSLYGRNLFFFSKKAPFDPEVGLNTGLGGQGVDFYSLPTTRSYGININVSF